MAKKGPRVTVKMESTAGTGHCYFTQKNTRNTTEKLLLVKYDPIVRKHVDYKEGKLK